jgi:O-antigen/teichoic acid export membrane protein
MIKSYFYFLRIFSKAFVEFKDINISYKLINYGWPFLVWGVFSWLQTTSDRYIIAKSLSLSQAAHFSLLLTIASFLVATPLSITYQFISPVIFKKYADVDYSGAYELQRRYRIFNVVLMFLVLIITFIWGDFLVSILNGNFSADAHIFLPIMCMSIGIFQLSQFNTLKGQLLGKPSIYLFSKLIAGIIFPVVSFFAIKFYGFSGLLLGGLISNIIYFILIYLSNLVVSKYV